MPIDFDILNGSDWVGSDETEGPGDPVGTDLQRRGELKQELKRLETFDAWPRTAPVKKDDLARNGFYYLQIGDKVKCIFCNLILRNWEAGDVVIEEHKKFNPLCPFLLNKNVGNVRLMSSQNPSNIKYPEYIDLSARQASFSGWPSHLSQRPDELARAGFFYTGSNDSVTCFHCASNLRNWDRDDDPVYEHRHWFPTCEFIKNLPARSAFEMNPTVQECLDMGYDPEIVRIVVNEKKRNGEPAVTDVNQLIDEVERLRFSQELQLGTRQEQVTSRSRSAEGTASQSQQAVAQSGSSTVQNTGSSTQNELRDLMDRLTCKICMEEQIEMTFQPCGHFVACEECSRTLSTCPICRETIRAMTRTYMS